MSTKIFVNLAVKDLGKSMEFFKNLGFTFNPKFTNDSAACMVISENIFSMLISEDKFRTFTPKQISDATKTTEVLNALTVESREKVNELVDKALKAGATENEPQDHGFMFVRSFNDPDGHIWEIFWMDESAANN